MSNISSGSRDYTPLSDDPDALTPYNESYNHAPGGSYHHQSSHFNRTAPPLSFAHGITSESIQHQERESGELSSSGINPTLYGLWQSFAQVFLPQSLVLPPHLNPIHLLPYSHFVSQLQPCDVILVQTPGLLYKQIRRVAHHKHDHMAIVLTHCTALHISPPFTRLIPVHNLLHIDRNPLILRPKLNAVERENILHDLFKLLGTPYDIYKVYSFLAKLAVIRSINEQITKVESDGVICTESIMNVILKHSALFQLITQCWAITMNRYATNSRPSWYPKPRVDILQASTLVSHHNIVDTDRVCLTSLLSSNKPIYTHTLETTARLLPTLIVRNATHPPLPSTSSSLPNNPHKQGTDTGETDDPSQSIIQQQTSVILDECLDFHRLGTWSINDIVKLSKQHIFVSEATHGGITDGKDQQPETILGGNKQQPKHQALFTSLGESHHTSQSTPNHTPLHQDPTSTSLFSLLQEKYPQFFPSSQLAQDPIQQGTMGNHRFLHSLHQQHRDFIPIPQFFDIIPLQDPLDIDLLIPFCEMVSDLAYRYATQLPDQLDGLSKKTPQLMNHVDVGSQHKPHERLDIVADTVYHWLLCSLPGMIEMHILQSMKHGVDSMRKGFKYELRPEILTRAQPSPNQSLVEIQQHVHKLYHEMITTNNVRPRPSTMTQTNYQHDPSHQSSMSHKPSTFQLASLGETLKHSLQMVVQYVNGDQSQPVIQTENNDQEESNHIIINETDDQVVVWPSWLKILPKGIRNRIKFLVNVDIPSPHSSSASTAVLDSNPISSSSNPNQHPPVHRISNTLRVLKEGQDERQMKQYQQELDAHFTNASALSPFPSLPILSSLSSPMLLYIWSLLKPIVRFYLIMALLSKILPFIIVKSISTSISLFLLPISLISHPTGAISKLSSPKRLLRKSILGRAAISNPLLGPMQSVGANKLLVSSRYNTIITFIYAVALASIVRALLQRSNRYLLERTKQHLTISPPSDAIQPASLFSFSDLQTSKARSQAMAAFRERLSDIRSISLPSARFFKSTEPTTGNDANNTSSPSTTQPVQHRQHLTMMQLFVESYRAFLHRFSQDANKQDDIKHHYPLNDHNIPLDNVEPPLSFVNSTVKSGQVLRDIFNVSTFVITDTLGLRTAYKKLKSSQSLKHAQHQLSLAIQQIPSKL